MKRSRLTLVAWIVLTVLTLGFFVQALVGNYAWSSEGQVGHPDRLMAAPRWTTPLVHCPRGAREVS